MTFYVIDASDNSVSWSAKTDTAESFSSRKAAEKRAVDLAKCEGGKIYEIVQTVAEVQCPVGAPKVTPRT